MSSSSNGNGIVANVWADGVDGGAWMQTWRPWGGNVANASGAKLIHVAGGEYEERTGAGSWEEEDERISFVFPRKKVRARGFQWMPIGRVRLLLLLLRK